CLVNPWHLRGAAFPITTIGYLRSQNAMAQNPDAPVQSPWGIVSEFQSPFGFVGFIGARWTTYAYLGLLALAAAGVVAALRRRRFGFALIIVLMTVMSMLMRRNIAQFA